MELDRRRQALVGQAGSLPIREDDEITQGDMCLKLAAAWEASPLLAMDYLREHKGWCSTPTGGCLGIDTGNRCPHAFGPKPELIQENSDG